MSTRQPRCAEPQPHGFGPPPGPDRHELAAPAADVDDEDVVLDRPALGDTDQHKERLFFVTEHVQRDTGGRIDLGDDPGGVGEPSQWLRANEGDGRRPGLAGIPSVSRKCVSELQPPGAPQETAPFDGRAEPEKDGLVDQRLYPMVDDPGDQQVDGGRAQVHGRADLLPGSLPRHRRPGRRCCGHGACGRCCG